MTSRHDGYMAHRSLIMRSELIAFNVKTFCALSDGSMLMVARVSRPVRT
jgi:hypothetical protein